MKLSDLYLGIYISMNLSNHLSDPWIYLPFSPIWTYLWIYQYELPTYRSLCDPSIELFFLPDSTCWFCSVHLINLSFFLPTSLPALSINLNLNLFAVSTSTLWLYDSMCQFSFWWGLQNGPPQVMSPGSKNVGFPFSLQDFVGSNQQEIY